MAMSDIVAVKQKQLGKKRALLTQETYIFGVYVRSAFESEKSASNIRGEEKRRKKWKSTDNETTNKRSFQLFVRCTCVSNGRCRDLVVGIYVKLIQLSRQ